ncbi:MAG: biosynthetic-type acetolactate synthase large subunit [Clostridiales Family XIII bacterium]|jgi:acetolactate synthase-1/2/3 large subunit|nr:biosynthetic-type acetolactate synthase large subunit [Clostridiales Family XIII bacterium]
MVLSGAKVIMECLLEQGVDTIFGYPGGAIMPLYDALYDYTDDGRVTHVLTSHEQGATHAADGYARSTGKVGVCFVTSGPGATNTVTGIATANMDSSPIVVFSGQVTVDSIGRDSFQEVDIVGITLPVVKHSFALRRVEDIATAVRKAFQIARSGRPGPVLIDIPKNLFAAQVEYEKQDALPLFPTPKADNENITRLAEAINSAQRPVIYAGGGVSISNASEQLTKLARKAHIPVGTTLMCLGCFDRRDPLSLGMVGMHGEKEANLAYSHADLLIAIGARFSDRVIGDANRFAQGAKIIQIDLDISEIDKNIETAFSIIGDVKEVLNRLIPLVQKNSHEEWLKQIEGWKRKDKKISTFGPDTIFPALYEIFGEDTIVATDVGQHQMWTAQRWPFSKSRNFITSGGLGTMGFGLGAAIGSAQANPGRQVILISGDGSFRMNLNELITVSALELPIIVFVMKNQTLGMVRQWQKLFFERRYSATDLPDVIDYEKLAGSFGLIGREVGNIDALKEAVAEIQKSGKGGVIACDINLDENVWPIVPPGDSIVNIICEE